MRKTRLYLPQAIHEGDVIALPPESAHHITSVLRSKVGDTLYLFNGTDGKEYTACIDFIKKSKVNVRITGYTTPDNESPIQPHLFQGIARPDHMDVSLQKAVELGVKIITPVICDRTQLKQNAIDKKMDHWQKIIISATQQSWRCYVPTLNPPIAFAEAVQSISAPNQTTLFFDFEQAESINLALLKNQTSINYWIGPEGGFSAQEAESARKHGAHITSLGPRVLRTETAAIAALSIIQHLVGDF